MLELGEDQGRALGKVVGESHTTSWDVAGTLAQRSCV